MAGFWTKKLGSFLAGVVGGDKRSVVRHWGVITEVDTANSWVYATLDGSETSTGPIPYNGSIVVPQVGETWAFDVVQNSWVAAHRSSAGPGSSPAITSQDGSVAVVQTGAITDLSAASPGSIDAIFSWPQLLSPLLAVVSGPYPVRQSVVCTNVALDATVGAYDPAHPITVAFYLSQIPAFTASDGVTYGTTEFTSASASFTSNMVGYASIGITGVGTYAIVGYTNAHTVTLGASVAAATAKTFFVTLEMNLIGTLTIPAGQYSSHADIPIASYFGEAGDLIQAQVTTYTGLVAAALVATVRTGA
jgi:hypothetical protein